MTRVRTGNREFVVRGYLLPSDSAIGVTVPTRVSAESRFETGLLGRMPYRKDEIRFLVASGLAVFRRVE